MDRSFRFAGFFLSCVDSTFSLALVPHQILISNDASDTDFLKVKVIRSIKDRCVGAIGMLAADLLKPYSDPSRPAADGDGDGMDPAFTNHRPMSFHPNPAVRGVVNAILSDADIASQASPPSR